MKKTWLIVVLFWTLPGASLAHEESPERLVPLRVEIVVHQGDNERVSHTLHVTANRSASTLLRRGQEIAVPGAAPDTRFQYRNVGTNIQCRAATRGDEFLVWFSMEQSALADASGTAPSFYTFNIMNELLLSDGQRAELVATSNEMWKVEVKLDVLD